MDKGIEKVIEFHRTTNSPVLKKPSLIPEDRWGLRVDLMQEELDELEDACIQMNKKEVLDALCDMQYILNGTIAEFGMQDIFEDAFNEVHESNMSKFCDNADDARKSVNKYMDKNIEAHYKLIGGKYVIMRSEDDKILKAISFKEPKLAQFLKASK